MEEILALQAWGDRIERRAIKRDGKMNLWQKLRLALAISKTTKEIGKVKAGWKTTEFWVTVFTAATGLLGTYGGFIPEPWGMMAAAVVGAGYTISRGLAKTGASNGQATGQTPKPS